VIIIGIFFKINIFECKVKVWSDYESKTKIVA